MRGLRTKAVSVALGVLGLISAPDVTGCTVCSSETGKSVRQGIFQKGFTSTLLATVAPVPFLLLGAIGISNLLGKQDKP
jgi:hypothetical protein